MPTYRHSLRFNHSIIHFKYSSPSKNAHCFTHCFHSHYTLLSWNCATIVKTVKAIVLPEDMDGPLAVSNSFQFIVHTEKLLTRGKRYLQLKWYYYSAVRASQTRVFLSHKAVSQFSLAWTLSFSLICTAFFYSCSPFPLHFCSMETMMPSKDSLDGDLQEDDTGPLVSLWNHNWALN